MRWGILYYPTTNKERLAIMDHRNNNDTRIKKIQRLYASGKTYQQIGDMPEFHLSRERIRQLVHWKRFKPQYCSKHKRYFRNECKYCKLEKEYRGFVNELSPQQFIQELAKLSVKKRTKDLVVKRAVIVQILTNKFHMSPRSIGDLLRRDRTTIIHYQKYGRTTNRRTRL